MKTCITCGKEKIKTEFYYSCRTDDELQTSCKSCYDDECSTCSDSFKPVKEVGRIW